MTELFNSTPNSMERPTETAPSLLVTRNDVHESARPPSRSTVAKIEQAMNFSYDRWMLMLPV